jgi:hypothetical protein
VATRLSGSLGFAATADSTCETSPSRLTSTLGPTAMRTCPCDRPKATALAASKTTGSDLCMRTVGIYGVMVVVVSQRGHEFGVRQALGPSAGDPWCRLTPKVCRKLARYCQRISGAPENSCTDGRHLLYVAATVTPSVGRHGAVAETRRCACIEPPVGPNSGFSWRWRWRRVRR